MCSNYAVRSLYHKLFVVQSYRDTYLAIGYSFPSIFSLIYMWQTASHTLPFPYMWGESKVRNLYQATIAYALTIFKYVFRRALGPLLVL